MKKRILSAILSVAVAFTALPFVAFAEVKTDADTGLEYRIITTDDGEEVEISDYNGDATEMVIPSTIEGLPVTSIGGFAFSDCKALESVTIPDSVTTIDLYAFSDCTALESVTIPDSVIAIESSTFNGCTSLESVTIPDSVTSIGGFAFYGCTSLESVTIPDSVTSIGGSALDDTPFYNNLDDGLVYFGDILYAYKGDMPENTTVEIKEGTTSISGSAFSSCTSLESITIPDSVTSIGGGAFSGCTALSSVTIPDSVTSIAGSAFSFCHGLEGVTIPDSVTSIGSEAFSQCASLESVTIPDSVTSIGYKAFYECTSLESVTIPDSVTSIGEAAFNYTLFYNNLEDGVVYFGNILYACKGEMQENTTVEIKEGTTTIASRAFYECKALESVTIPDSVTSIEESAFSGCTALESVTIPDSVTSIGKYAFSGCTALSSVTIPDSVTDIGYDAFYGCTSLESVTIPDSVTSIDSSVFESCTALSSVTIPDSVTIIWNSAFANCASLESIVIPDSVEYIAESVFSYCTSLESVTIPDSVIAIVSLTFSGCTALESIIIPNSVEFIEDNAFSDCTSLTDIYFIGTEEEWNEINYQFDERATVHFSSITTPSVGSGTEDAQVEIEKDVVYSLLTDEDLSSGEEIRVETKIDVLEKAPEEDAKAIETMAKTLNKDITQLQVLDIDLTKYVGNTATEITDLNGKEITITVDIPENLRDSSKTFAVVRVHDGVAEILDDLDTSDETITFKTGKFSTYAIVEVKNVAAVVPGDDDKDDSQVGTPDDDDDDITDTENPKTGENTNMIFLSIIALVAVAGIYGAKKKLVK